MLSELDLEELDVIVVFRGFVLIREFFWFYDEWEIINRRFVKKFGKRLQHILMEMQHLHRVKKENLILMENVRKLEDRGYGDANKAVRLLDYNNCHS